MPGTLPMAHDIEAGFPAVYVPAQKPVPSQPSLADDARVSLSSYPPLSQVTVVDAAAAGQLSFILSLDVHIGRGQRPWQAALCLSDLGDKDNDGWTEEPLHESIPSETPLPLQAADPSVFRLCFSLSVPAPVHSQSPIRFSFKFRESAGEPWRLAREELAMDDGVIVWRAERVPTPESLGDAIQGLNPAVAVSPAVSQCSGTSLWVIEAPVAGVAGDDRSVFADFDLGLPWGGILRWFSLARAWSPWLAPSHGRSDFSSLDKDSVMCSFLSHEGKHLVLLAVSGLGSVTSVLRSNKASHVVLRARSDSVGPSSATVLAAVGDDFERANAAVMYHARDLVQGVAQTVRCEPAHASAGREEDNMHPEWLENWYDGLGFCTWNALGQRLTEEKLTKALDALAESKIMISNLIIDDNWQNIDYNGNGQFQYGWKEFEAEPTAFPRGLKETVSAIRSRHPGIQHVAVWHALLGYWGGISPEDGLARTYQTVEVVREDAKRRNLPLGGTMTVVSRDDVPRFYDDFYRFLSSCGVDAVKTDAQFMIDTWVGAEARRELAPAYLDAWSIASLRYFGSRAVSCMSQTPRIIFHSQLPRNRPAMLLRNSDDFFPDIPSSHPWHVWTNAYNSLLTQHLNIVPDWDMFQTSHDYSGFHAAARCVSGGPIYITDVPGQHDMDLIAQMTGITPRGKTAIFRPSVLGKSIDPYVGYTDDSLLKIGCFHGTSSTGGSPVLGVFNTSLRALADVIPLSRFPGAQASTEYVVRSHKSAMVTPPIRPGTPHSLLSLTLEVRGYDVLSAFPLSTFETGVNSRISVANMGLLGKMAGAAAVISSSLELVTGGRVLLQTRMKALGILGVYISRLPEMAVQDNFIATIQGSVIPPHTVAVSEHDQRVLTVDTESAWREMRLEGGWSNEVELKLYMTFKGASVE